MTVSPTVKGIGKDEIMPDGERLLYKNAHLQILAKCPAKKKSIKGCALELLSRRPIRRSMNSYRD
jgi:hypothetical protein